MGWVDRRWRQWAVEIGTAWSDGDVVDSDAIVSALYLSLDDELEGSSGEQLHVGALPDGALATWHAPHRLTWGSAAVGAQSYGNPVVAAAVDVVVEPHVARGVATYSSDGSGDQPGAVTDSGGGWGPEETVVSNDGAGGVIQRHIRLLSRRAGQDPVQLVVNAVCPLREVPKVWIKLKLPVRVAQIGGVFVRLVTAVVNIVADAADVDASSTSAPVPAGAGAA